MLLQIHNIHMNFWIDRAGTGRHFEKIYFSGLVVQGAMATTSDSDSSSVSMPARQLQLPAISKETEVSEGTTQTDNDMFPKLSLRYMIFQYDAWIMF